MWLCKFGDSHISRIHFRKWDFNLLVALMFDFFFLMSRVNDKCHVFLVFSICLILIFIAFGCWHCVISVRLLLFLSNLFKLLFNKNCKFPCKLKSLLLSDIISGLQKIQAYVSRFKPLRARMLFVIYCFLRVYIATAIRVYKKGSNILFSFGLALSQVPHEPETLLTRAIDDFFFLGRYKLHEKFMNHKHFKQIGKLLERLW